jgi:D-arabinose 1-dehydrogenase-like Zn-dependent alcohol dehydrogenase
VFPDKDQALEKITDLTILSDIFPTGFHGAYTAGTKTGSTVYVAGAGPVGIAAAVSAQLLGASVVIVGDLNKDRLAQARKHGCERPWTSRRAIRGTRSNRSSAFPKSIVVWTPSFRDARTRKGLREGGAGDRAELADGHHRRRRCARHPGPVRNG